jgi:hypothetical protein
MIVTHAESFPTHPGAGAVSSTSEIHPDPMGPHSTVTQFVPAPLAITAGGETVQVYVFPVVGKVQKVSY